MSHKPTPDSSTYSITISQNETDASVHQVFSLIGRC